ncbi:MAG: ABC transporter ATP-binding protein [Lentisphaeria bacterium]|nr:ABC transporter ATP-binding protein [Lentisphaeria bacterium]
MIGAGISGGPRGLLQAFGEQSEGGQIRGGVLLGLLPFVRPYRRALGAAGLLTLLSTGGGLLIPLLTRHLIDIEIAQGDLAGLLRRGGWLALVMLATYLGAGGQSYLLALVGQKTLYSLRARLFEHLQRLSVAYHDRHIVGVTVSRVINDVSVIQNLLSEGLVTLVGDSILIVGTVVVMLLLDPRLALAALAVFPVMVLVTVLFSRRARDAYRETRENVAVLVGNLAENIGGMRVIQSFAREETSQRRFEENNWRNRTAHVRAMSLSFTFLPAMDFLSVAATCLILLVGGMLVTRGAATIGTVVAFMTYVNRLFAPIRELSQLYTTLQSATAGGERVLQLLRSRPQVQDGPEAVDVPDIRGGITFRGVCFAYPDGSEVLHDVSLDVQPGETVAIVGPTGAGKTTIANLVCRFYEPSAGSIRIDGRPLREITLRSLHGRMALVSQDPFLFPTTLAENIGFGSDNPERGAIVQAAKHAEADGFISHLPLGYDTPVQEGGANLSTGQRQLISIARAIFVSPRILIMDEATSSVDTMTEALIQKALGYLLRDRTAIVIAHRLTTVRRADRIYVMEGGRIVEQGRHEELIRTDGLYSRLYERQFVSNAGA